jgi:hypothetical protein
MLSKRCVLLALMPSSKDVFTISLGNCLPLSPWTIKGRLRRLLKARAMCIERKA